MDNLGKLKKQIRTLEDTLENKDFQIQAILETLDEKEKEIKEIHENSAAALLESGSVKNLNFEYKAIISSLEVKLKKQT